MIREGYFGCSTCHVGPEGGSTLTAYGRVQSDLLLSMHYGKGEPESVKTERELNAETGGSPEHSEEALQDEEAWGDDGWDDDGWGDDGAEAAGPMKVPRMAGFLFGALAPEDTTPFWTPDSPIHMLLGGDFRWMTLYTPAAKNVRTFPMQLDLSGELQAWMLRFGGSIGMIKLREGSMIGRAAQVTTGDTGLQMVSRTYYVGGQVTPEILIRAGRLNLPFSVAGPNHILWVRTETYTDRVADQELGLEVSYSGDWVRASVMGIGGNIQVHPSEYWKHGFSGFAEFLVARGATVGVSALATVADQDLEAPEIGRTVRQAYGVFSRLVPWSPLVFTLEADALLRTAGDVGAVGLAEVDVQLVQGLHLDAAAEFLRPAEQEPPNRWGAWVGASWFFLPHFNVRVDGRFRQGESFTLMSQLHIYL